MKNFFLLLLSVAAAMTSANSASADTTKASQDHAQIRNAAAIFVQQQTAALPGKASYQVDEIDRRIALPACARLEAFLPPGSQLIGKTSIGVRCNEANGWSIFVPVQIRLNLNLLVSARQLSPGHTLRAQDLATQTMETSKAIGFTDPKQVIGKVLRYGITAGQILREDMLRQAYSVTQGQVVQLATQGSGFSIRNEGVALGNAGEGQPVQVRTGSGRVIGGIARTVGLVEIGP